MAEELESNTGDRIALALQGFAAGMQGRGQEFLGQLDERRQNAMIQDAIQVQEALQQGNIDRAKGLLQQRAQLINKLGGDPSDTLGVLGRLNEGDVAGALKDVSTVTEYAYQSGRLQRPQAQTQVDMKTGQAVQVTPEGKVTAQKIEGFTPPNKATMAGTEGFQFGESLTLKDDEGRLFVGTQVRDPATGEITPKFAAVDGTGKPPTGRLQIAGQYGLTANEKVQQVGEEAGAGERQKESAQFISEAKRQGLAAKGLMNNTERLLELNGLISTGSTANAKRLFANLFNIESADAANLAEFNQLSGQMVLGMIRQLGANPTEGERAYLTSIAPSIEQGNAPNDAMLKNLLEIQKRQFERGKWLSRNPKASIDDLYAYEAENDFAPAEQKRPPALIAKPEQQASDDELINKYLR